METFNLFTNKGIFVRSYDTVSRAAASIGVTIDEAKRAMRNRTEIDEHFIVRNITK